MLVVATYLASVSELAPGSPRADATESPEPAFSTTAISDLRAIAVGGSAGDWLGSSVASSLGEERLFRPRVASGVVSDWTVTSCPCPFPEVVSTRCRFLRPDVRLLRVAPPAKSLEPRPPPAAPAPASSPFSSSVVPALLGSLVRARSRFRAANALRAGLSPAIERNPVALASDGGLNSMMISPPQSPAYILYMYSMSTCRRAG